MKTIIPSLVLPAALLLASFLHADSLVIEGDLAVEGANAVSGEFAVNEDNSLIAPAVKAAFKVESNGVIWAGEADDFDAANQVPVGAGARIMWIPIKSAFMVGTEPWEGAFAYNNQANVGNHSIRFDQGFSYGDHTMSWGNASTTGLYGTAWGHSWAWGDYSTAWGAGDARGTYATAWGGAYTSADYSTAWGGGNAAQGFASTAWGFAVGAGDYATAWGRSVAWADYATAWGGGMATALGDYSTAWGMENVAESYASTVFGLYAVGIVADPANSSTTPLDLDSLLEIGNGFSASERKNAVTVLKNGQTTLQNRYWDAATPTVIPIDAENGALGDGASAGEALVVNGHTQLNGNTTFAGNVTLAVAQGDISMGAFGAQ